MPAEHQNTTHVQTLADLMNAVCEARVRQRAAAFSAFHSAMIPFLRGLSVTDLVESRRTQAELEKFRTQSMVYLRALATYPAATDEWMTLFVRFKRLFEVQIFGKPLAPRRAERDPYRPDADLVRFTVR